jgi:hypothetical protein
MQPMRSRDMECRVLIFFLVRGREGFSFQGVIGEQSGQSTVQCPNWTANSRLSMQAFLFLFFCGRARRGGAVRAKTSQVSDMFPKEFSVAPHFCHICFGKCCSPFTFISVNLVHNAPFKFPFARSFPIHALPGSCWPPLLAPATRAGPPPPIG